MNNYLEQVAENSAKTNELLEEIHTAIELSGVSSVADLGAGDPPPFITPLSYLLLQQQTAGPSVSMSNAMMQIIGAMFVGCSVSEWDHHLWSKDNQVVLARYQDVDHSEWDVAVRYVYKGIDADESGYEIGNEVRDNEQPYEQKSYGWLIDLTRSTVDLAFEREERVALEQSNSMEVTKGMEIDVGTETEVSGSIPGTGFEAKVSASFGYKDTEEEKRAEAESQTNEQATKIAETVPAGLATLIPVVSNDVDSHTPKSWNGVVLYQVTVEADLKDKHGDDAPWLNAGTFMGKYCKHGPRYKVVGGKATWTWLWPEFLAFLWGRDTELPYAVNKTLADWHIMPGCKPTLLSLQSARDQLNDGKLRHISLDGYDIRNYKEGATVTPEDVTGQDLNAVAEAHGIPPSRILSPDSYGFLRNQHGELYEKVSDQWLEYFQLGEMEEKK